MAKEEVVKIVGFQLEQLIKEAKKPAIMHFGGGKNQKVFSFTEDKHGCYNLVVGQFKDGVVFAANSPIKPEEVEPVAVLAFETAEALGAIAAFLNMAYQSALAEAAEKEGLSVVEPEKPTAKRGRPKKQD